MILLYSTIGFSQQLPAPSNQDDQPPNFFWTRMRQIFQISPEVQESFVLNLKANHYLYTISHLMRQTLFHDHFSNKFQNSNNKFFERHIPTMQVIAQFLNLFKNGQIQEIKNFMTEQKFTKSDQILSLTLSLFNNWIGEEVFVLMDSLGLSVNESLPYKNITSQFIQDDFKNSDEMVVVLSHHLAGTGDPRIIKKLLKRDFDINKKTLTGMTVLHSFILLNYFRQEYKVPMHSDYQKAFRTLAEQAYPLLKEKDLLGWDPVSLAGKFNNTTIVQILNELGALPEGIDHPEDPITEEITNRQKEIPPDTSQQKGETLKGKKTINEELTYFNFEPFLKNLIQALSHFNPGVPQQYFTQIYESLKETLTEYETIRIHVLNYILNFNQQNQESAVLLKAILNRDKSFFKNLSLEMKHTLGHTNFLHQVSEGPQSVFVSNILLEAIRHSFLPAVQSIKQLSERVGLENGQMSTYSLDPLSLAIVTYASLDEKSPLKKPAKRIIKLVAEKDFIGPKGENTFFINFSPLDWAIFLGLLDEVKFLYEQKTIQLNTHIGFSSFPNKIELSSWAERQGFIHLANYLNDKIEEETLKQFPQKDQKKSEKDSCRKVFLH